MKKKNKGKIRWQTLVYLFFLLQIPSPTAGAENGRYSFPSLFWGQEQPCVPHNDLREKLQRMGEGVWEWFSCQIMGKRSLMSASSCFLPVWSSCRGSSCGHEGKSRRTMAVLTQSYDMVNYGTNSWSAPVTFLLPGENKFTLTKPLVVRWSVACKQNFTLYR